MGTSIDIRDVVKATATLLDTVSRMRYRHAEWEGEIHLLHDYYVNRFVEGARYAWRAALKLEEILGEAKQDSYYEGFADGEEEMRSQLGRGD